MKDGGDQLFERAFQAWIGQRLHGLIRVGNVQGGVWVVLKLEWNPTTPPVESCRGCSSFHQPHPLIFLFLSLCGSPISIFPFFLASAAASLSPISFFPFFFTVASFLVPATDALPVFLLYFGCYEH